LDGEQAVKWVAILLALSMQLIGSGKAEIEKLMQEYKEGKHALFLKAIDEKYHSEEKRLLGFSESVRSYARGVDEERLTGELKKFHQNVLSLTEERNQKLEKLAASHPEAPIGEIIRSLSRSQLTKEQEEAMSFVASLDEGKKSFTDPLELRLQKIAEEYGLKNLLIHLAFISQEIDQKAASSQKILIEKEKLEKMLVACQKESEAPAAKKIKIANELFIPQAIDHWNWGYLRSLEREEVQPVDKVEKEAKIILKEYRDKMNLYRSK
jgi:hypothetical protein